MSEKLKKHTTVTMLNETGLIMEKSGILFKALCPYHKEKTPSFIYDPRSKRFHCFGCGKSGKLSELKKYLKT